MSLISLDPDQARATASSFDNGRGSMESALNNMINSVNQVTATWQGQNRQQFEAQWSQASQNLRNLMEELQRLSNGLRREAEEFEISRLSLRKANNSA